MRKLCTTLLSTLNLHLTNNIFILITVAQWVDLSVEMVFLTLTRHWATFIRTLVNLCYDCEKEEGSWEYKREGERKKHLLEVPTSITAFPSLSCRQSRSGSVGWLAVRSWSVGYCEIALPADREGERETETPARPSHVRGLHRPLLFSRFHFPSQ